LPATFDHTGITGNCISCHDGVTATGKGPTHIQTTNVCEDCHSTIIWTPALTVDHGQVLGLCSSCHNGTIAIGKNPGHFGTARECDECHVTVAWIPADYSHIGLPYEPLDHQLIVTCTNSSCHQGNNEIVIWPSPAYQPDCAGCHANTYEPGPHKKWETPTTMYYTIDELRDCTGACHMYTDSSQTTIEKNRPGPEHRITNGDF
jgi:predicted CxxxxCH...CXXCH cytochrome family protein